ncbi:uncharacterized protein LOC111320686 [Stylophora pistillata]|uniref:uncharacterized protein LOC111320686 n=1 Tax=Stylophora pistillata TaxID=50429 RepID=UPI000C044AF7|nr:uncharacterized protein LOC111320686 [Stylophora pistillata]XP_022779085.1 uncharacterized protein LOC111320686 [Stylophora pistillata]XP_022779086.1 uncharacterized protein LOC111320686 [Stylophora pistillata]XP_022779088.1 uncharacterized protein LOC111320686 [Stylophora pistillata]
MDVLMNTGFTSTISLEKKDTIVRVITLQNTIMRVKGELDQMREGLRLHGCLAIMEEYPSLMEKLFVPGEDYTVTSTFLMNSLTAEYSEPGSTRKLQETAVMAYFNRYVEEREDNLSESTNSAGGVTEIFQFLTGKTTMPFLPAEKNSFTITVKFMHCSNDH